MTLRRQIATTIRRFPYLLYLPHMIYRFLRPKYTMGVVGILFNEAHQVLLVEHVFHAKRPWGLPGGWVDRNEDPAQAVMRELAEELQLQVAIDVLILARRTAYNHVDLAYCCTPHNTIGQLSPELLAYQWYDVDALPPLRQFHHEAILIAHAHLQESEHHP